jgi:regulator of replication initiation timing
MEGIDVWRARIGTFAGGRRKKYRVTINSLTIGGKHSLGTNFAVILLIVLTLCGDIETNPGPQFTADQQSCGSGISDDQGGILMMQNVSESMMAITMQDIMMEIKKMRNDLHIYQREVNNWRENIDTQIHVLQKENTRLSKEVQLLRDRTDNCESFQRRKNVVIHGMQENEGADPAQQFKNFLTEGLSMADITVSARWLKGNRDNRPLLVEFNSVDEKRAVLNAMKLKLTKDSKIRVKNDLPPSWRAARQKLAPFYKDAVEKGSDVRVEKDYLIVDNMRFTYNDTTKSLDHVADYRR